MGQVGIWEFVAAGGGVWKSANLKIWVPGDLSGNLQIWRSGYLEIWELEIKQNKLVRSPDPQPREVRFEKCCVNPVDSFRYTIGTVYLMGSLCFSYCASKQKSNSEIWIYRHRKIEEYRPIALCARCVIPYKYGRCCMFSSGNVRKSL